MSKHLLGLPYDITVDQLLFNNHIKLYDHCIVAIANVPVVVLMENLTPLCPIYIPTNDSNISISYWRRDIDDINIWNFEDYNHLLSALADDYELIVTQHTNTISNIIYKVNNINLIDDVCVSIGSLYKFEDTPIDTIRTLYVAGCTRTINYEE